MSLDRAEFLKTNHFSESEWEASRCSWDMLCCIRDDYKERMDDLAEVAEFHARMLQKLPKVHSVRWRVKNPNSLIAKIIRKAANGDEKYLSVNEGNYTSLITDLVGVRALHLFKSDYSEIHEHIKRKWELVEPVVAYIRSGDRQSIRSDYEAVDMTVAEHPFGYRSIHYIVRSQPKKTDVFAEFQLRTIFEEGWSEIDHKIKYPNLSDDQLVKFFLDIFNRAAGSADEMGDFAYELSQRVADHNNAIEIANNEHHVTLAKLTKTVEELQSVTSQSEEMAAIVDRLRAEVQVLKLTSLRETKGEAVSRNALGALGLPTAEMLSALSGLKVSDLYKPNTNESRSLNPREMGLNINLDEILKSVSRKSDE